MRFVIRHLRLVIELTNHESRIASREWDERARVGEETA
jgi:hypothetical protein